MGRGLNKVMIIGNLGSDPEMRYTSSGTPITHFNVATNRTWVTDGDRREGTEWFNVVAFGNLAENCNDLLTKRQLVYIEGRLQSRERQDDQGRKYYKVEIVANEMIVLGERLKQYESDSDTASENDESEEYSDDDLRY